MIGLLIMIDKQVVFSFCVYFVHREGKFHSTACPVPAGRSPLDHTRAHLTFGQTLWGILTPAPSFSPLLTLTLSLLHTHLSSPPCLPYPPIPSIPIPLPLPPPSLHTLILSPLPSLPPSVPFLSSLPPVPSPLPPLHGMQKGRPCPSDARSLFAIRLELPIKSRNLIIKVRGNPSVYPGACRY